ncbi:hypothetical protein VPNG_03027 [Cytospora leucostoma]|uniref:Zn(2)-C6 fungal-type domain-containing protein n=1 Tax=Cytospora leucostoma TaxID=1230097 RepID=A0A423XGB1_9PEZI|nr:hypothetical protein VPNG_03027 [Cytospora leucostoma]
MARPQRDAVSPAAGGGNGAGRDPSDNNSVVPRRDVNKRLGNAVITDAEQQGNDGQGSNSQSRKRPRLRLNDQQNMQSNMPSTSNSNQSSAACDQCRFRKVRCDRQQPECSNCRKGGIACNQTSNFKRPAEASSKLTITGPFRRDDFSSVLYRLDEIDDTLGTLTKLAKQFTDGSHPLIRGGLNWSREHVDEESDPFPSPSNTPASRSKSPAPGNHRPCLVLPSSRPDYDQGRQEIQRGLKPSVEDDFPTDRVELEHGGERKYRYPAPFALLKSLSRRIVGSCQVADININEDNADYTATASARATMLRQLECFPFLGKCPQPAVSKDRRPVVAPPQLISRLFVDGFLRSINSRIPIFDEKSLRDAVDTYYSGISHVPSSASSTSPSAPVAGENITQSPWAIIFTNISLLGLGLETHATRWQGTSVGSSSISTSLLTDDLISSFLRNCDRALADLTPYTRPSLLHVQALLTLTACHVGRMLGLHLSKAHESIHVSDESPTERERVFRVLYGMDKQRAFLTGGPCDLYHFDSDLELWQSVDTKPDDVDSPRRKLIAAFDDMMMIWEEIYLKLYSARAIAAGASYASSQVAGLKDLLTKWHEHHPGILETTMFHPQSAEDGNGSGIQRSIGGRDVDDLVSIQFELRYCYHVTQVLVLRYERSDDEPAQMQMRHHTRTSLQLIVEMSNIGDGTRPTPSRVAKARLATLSRVLGSYPMIAFMDLVEFRLDEFIPSRTQPTKDLSRGDSLDAEADIKLLHAVPRLVQGLQHADRPSTYLNRLGLGLEWAARVLDETRKAWLMSTGQDSREFSVIVPSSPALGANAISTDGSTGAVNSSILASGWEDLPSTLRQTQQQHEQVKNPASASDRLDMDMGMPASTQAQMPANSGFTPVSLELGAGTFGSMYDAVGGWSAAQSLDGMGEGGGGHVPRTSTAGCGFHGLDLWQDFFMQEKPDSV